MNPVQKWIKHFRSYDTSTIHKMLWISLALVALGVFIVLTWELREDDDISEFDKVILNWISHHRIRSFNGPAVDITALGSVTVLTLFSGIGISILLLTKDAIGALHLSISSLGSAGFTLGLKGLIARERPEFINRLVEVSGYSYPSGHSLSAAAIFLTIAVLVSRHFRSYQSRIVIFGMALMMIGFVGISRVYLGVHYPSDVLSGMFFGSAWSLFLAGMFSSRYWKSNPKRIKSTNR